MTRIKFCGLVRPEDVDAVNRVKPDFAGFVVDVPRSRRNVSVETLRALRARLDAAVRPVGVFVDSPPERVAALLRDGTLYAAQLHGREDAAYVAALRRLAPGAVVWQAFRLHTAADAAAAAASPADRVLLDGGAGEGRTFPWELAEGFPRPFLLAGGLTAENLPAAIRRLHPWGVDLSSGLETHGRKDFEQMLAAAAAVRTEDAT